MTLLTRTKIRNSANRMRSRTSPNEAMTPPRPKPWRKNTIPARIKAHLSQRGATPLPITSAPAATAKRLPNTSRRCRTKGHQVQRVGHALIVLRSERRELRAPRPRIASSGASGQPAGTGVGGRARALSFFAVFAAVAGSAIGAGTGGARGARRQARLRAAPGRRLGRVPGHCAANWSWRPARVIVLTGRSGDGSGDGPGLGGGAVAPVDLQAEPGLGGGSGDVEAVAAGAGDLGPDRPHPVGEAVRPGPA